MEKPLIFLREKPLNLQKNFQYSLARKKTLVHFCCIFFILFKIVYLVPIQVIIWEEIIPLRSFYLEPFDHEVSQNRTLFCLHFVFPNHILFYFSADHKLIALIIPVAAALVNSVIWWGLFFKGSATSLSITVISLGFLLIWF